jgi:hypothetical protein
MGGIGPKIDSNVQIIQVPEIGLYKEGPVKPGQATGGKDAGKSGDWISRNTKDSNPKSSFITP